MTRNRKIKMAALNVTALVAIVALSAPFIALGTYTDNVPVVLASAISYALAAYAIAHLRGLVRSDLRGPTGYVCRHCGPDMTVSLCAMGHTHEAVTTPAEYAADQRKRRAAKDGRA